MQLSIITINRNDALGLKKTLESVMNQTGVEDLEIEHIIVDGASTDESVPVLRRIGGEAEGLKGGEAERLKGEGIYVNGIHYRWISEPDKGIYNAMNKGIRMATGEYIEILNSADCLADNQVCVQMIGALTSDTDILMGNIIDLHPGQSYKSKLWNKSKLHLYDVNISMLSFYRGTVPHDAALMRKSVLERYGLYDEHLRICSDWKLFMQVMALGLWTQHDGTYTYIPPIEANRIKYINRDVVLFDMTGLSNQNADKWAIERRPVLENSLLPMVLKDYDTYADDIFLIRRIRRHHLYPLTRFVERVLFKLEKWHLITS